MEVHTEDFDRAFDNISASCPQLSWLSVQKKPTKKPKNVFGDLMFATKGEHLFISHVQFSV